MKLSVEMVGPYSPVSTDVYLLRTRLAACTLCGQGTRAFVGILSALPIAASSSAARETILFAPPRLIPEKQFVVIGWGGENLR